MDSKVPQHHALSLPVDDDSVRRLMQAALHGHIHIAKPLLYGVSADVRDRTGRTPLSWIASYDLAARPDNRSVPEQFVRFLLEKGADPNLGDQHGETPLHWAAKAGDDCMVDLLLQNGVHSDLADRRGRTPLSRAAERGHAAVVKLLLTAGRADADSKDARGRTPLSWAAETGRLETARILLDHGASVDIQDHEGQIPLWWFISNAVTLRTTDERWDISPKDFQQWLDLLGSNHGVEPLTKARRTFLSWACERGDKKLVEHLLRTTWADPNTVDRYRKTPLIYALEWDHYDIVELLLSGAVDSDTKRRDIVSLRIMVQEGRSRILKSFLERYKPSLEEEDEYGSFSLIRMALSQGDRTTVTVLLEHKATIECLENADWFGPCSTTNPATELVPLKIAHVDHNQHSVPVMDMTIKDADRGAIATLLRQRAKILQLKEDDEEEGYGTGHDRKTGKASTAVYIAALRDGRKKARWIRSHVVDREVRALPRVTEETHLILFRENYVWNTYCQMDHSPNRLLYSLGHRGPCRTFTLSIRVDVKMRSVLSRGYDGDEYSRYQDHATRTVEWVVLEAPLKTIHYFSNLPYGWIPQNDVELVQLFMQTLRDDWMAFCQDARNSMGELRSHQLTARGKDDVLIDTVAESMLQWTHIQGILSEQLSQARSFVSQYQRFSETRRFSEKMSEIIDALDRDVTAQIEKLEQTVRDILQIEFAWVTINEAHRSTGIAASLQRLSWITFIFLPLMFASSLFGMNVDVLKNDPSWRWYPLVGGVLLLLTLVVWISSKFTNVDQIEHKTRAMARRSMLRLQPARKDFTTQKTGWL
ncbi:ankyrin repeat-containing domain protein [Aspergillus taichungensis]|uniref:Ankyrin repeat-containing domain protein n=1 Tax=Aspergillus taichungensis TaxID=482145 RepID=A0A2J5I355_9EURO|nr:ankyrin repeat-containing domain protein [Aspergillus taichungensis]